MVFIFHLITTKQASRLTYSFITAQFQATFPVPRGTVTSRRWLIKTSVMRVINKHYLTFPTPTPWGAFNERYNHPSYDTSYPLCHRAFGWWANKLPSPLKYLMIEYLSHSLSDVHFPFPKPPSVKICGQKKKIVLRGRHYFLWLSFS